MRILVLGASGGCGRWVTRLASEAGHQVTALVRPSTPFLAPESVEVRTGSALDARDVRAALEGADVVISCIGPQRVNPRNPWSPLRQPPRVAEVSARAVVEAMEASGARRFLAISAAGVGDSLPKTNPMMRWLIARSTIGEMYADLTAMESVLAASGLDWMAVRPVTLFDAGPSSRAKVVQKFRAHSTISRGDVAAWLLRAAVSEGPLVPRTPMIAWW